MNQTSDIDPTLIQSFNFNIFIAELVVTFVIISAILHIKNKAHILRELSNSEVEKIIEIKIEDLKQQLT